MDVLNSIITGMSKEQIRFFKLFQGRSHSKESRMDVRLFDYMRKTGEKYDEEKIHGKLYGSNGAKNSFYRLRNRLLHDVNRSLLVQYFDEDELLHTLHLIALEKFHFSRNNILAAKFYLKKAEAEASRTENHELLDIIYGDYIRLSHELLSIDPEQYVSLRRENQEKIRHVRTIDDILAVVSFRMKRTQNFSTGDNPVITLLQKTVAEFSKDQALLKSPLLRFRMYHAVSRILLQKRDYPALEDYLLTTFREFEKEKLFTRTNQDTRLQMLVFIINTLFKNNQTKESLKWTERLKSGMEDYQRLHYDKYLFYYYNSLVINYSKVDKDRAIEILLEMKDNDKIRSNPFNEVFVYLNLSVLNFDKADFHRSVRYLNKLYQLDGFERADRSLRFKIFIAELMIRYELKDFDVLESKIKQTRKEFKEYFSKKENSRETLMVDVIEKLMAPEPVRKQSLLMNRIRKEILARTDADNSDAEILNYRNWLMEKVR